MKKTLTLAVAAIACAAFISIVNSTPSNAAVTFTTDKVKLAYHFKTGDKCGVGTSCFVDKEGELQGWAITPRHIVVAHSINLGYNYPGQKNYNSSQAKGKVRLYFIDRKTKKIVKMIPSEKNFTCNKGGKPGCYGHGSTIAYNSKTDKIWIATTAGYYQFSDKTMKYEKLLVPTNISSKITFNDQSKLYYTGVSEFGDRFINSTFKVKKTTKTALSTCAQHEEGPGTWNSYVITNTYRHQCNLPAAIRIYNYKTGKFLKEILISKDAIHTDVVEQVVMQEDGTMLLGVPTTNDRSKWGPSMAIYAISAKALGIGKSTNVKIGYYDVKAASITSSIVNTVKPTIVYK